MHHLRLLSPLIFECLGGCLSCVKLVSCDIFFVYRGERRLAPSPFLEFRLPCEMKKRRKWYLAVCPSLDVASQGPSGEKALDNLRDAIPGFLADCFEHGRPEEVSQQAGFVSARNNVCLKSLDFSVS